jgi:tellurite resistance protein
VGSIGLAIETMTRVARVSESTVTDVETSGPRPSIEHLPVSIFASVMGIGGLALAIAQFETALKFAPTISPIFAGLTGVLWLVLAGLYLFKLLRHPEAVQAELNHPIRLSFFPTISIGVILLSLNLLPYSVMGATVAFWVAVVGQIAFTLIILNRWLHHEHFRVEHNSPAWFIPIVANVLIAVPGPQLGYTEVSYFFFAIGTILWLPMLGVALNRAFFFAGLPSKLRPTLFVMIAPPALIFLAWVELKSQALDDFAVVLYFFALFVVLMLVSQFKYFLRLEFGLSWWSFTFPLTAVTIAAFTFYSIVPQLHYLIIALSLLVVTFLVVVMVSVLTVRSAILGKICLPE